LVDQNLILTSRATNPSTVVLFESSVDRCLNAQLNSRNFGFPSISKQEGYQADRDFAKAQDFAEQCWRRGLDFLRHPGCGEQQINSIYR
jgi:hypothetical protein